MYLSFFGLAENPFSLAPDPRYLFMGASHRDALAQLEARRGIAVLTGEAGTGKTLLLLALRDRLDADTAVAYVFNTTLPFDGIVEFLLEDLGIAKPEESPARRLAALNSFLSERERAGQSMTRIVDEAQGLDELTLAQLGMLANLERARQPASDCRSYSYSGGVPRVINIPSDHCLLFAYADYKRRVDRHLTNRAIAYLEDGSRVPRSMFPIDGSGSAGRLRRILETAGIALVSALAGFALSLLSGQR